MSLDLNWRSANRINLVRFITVELSPGPVSGCVEMSLEDQSLDERIRRAVVEDVALVEYDSRWPALFLREKNHLQNCLPSELVGRIEHFGSTAIPGMSAKPIIDIMVEVSDLGETRRRVAPQLVAQGYDYFWRPTHGDDGPPFYAWFIKRDPVSRTRTHHLHMVEPDFNEHWDRLLFRDYLKNHPHAAREYQRLKHTLAAQYSNDRVAYTQGKSEFIARIMPMAKTAGESNA